MLDHIVRILDFMIEAFLHIWPYLLVTIPLAVAVNLSGASRYINRAFQARPLVAIVLATVVGAFSPFCSCGVIPVIAALLMGGVPLAPVMSFWIASPSMDPEMFFLSVSVVGWELAVWRLVATLALSLSAGFVTHLIAERGWLGSQILRRQQTFSVQGAWALLRRGWQGLKPRLASLLPAVQLSASPALVAEATCCDGSVASGVETVVGYSSPADSELAPAGEGDAGCGGSGCSADVPFSRRLLNETWGATLMVAKFMALAFFLEALIELYVPAGWIAGLLGAQNPWAILTAAVLGVPVYTSNMAALPMISGLLAQGMDPAAALAFLIAGPTTTLPAMSAVWGLVSRRVFVLYISFSLVGAVVLGYVYSWIA